VFGTG